MVGKSRYSLVLKFRYVTASACVQQVDGEKVTTAQYTVAAVVWHG